MLITVEELIEKLKKLDPKRVVVLASDSEGSAYYPLFSVQGDMVVVKTERVYEVQVFCEKFDKGLEDCGYTEEELVYKGTDGKPAVVLFP